jgi:hypothetical protein
MATVIACPTCRQQLQIPAEMLGKAVQCPQCRHIFTADPSGAAAATAMAAEARGGAKEPPPAPLPDEEFAEPIAEPSYGEVQRKDRKKKSRPASSYYDELLKSHKRRIEPHRGVTILVLGILSLACPGLIGPICGVFAWIMGTNDLNEIHAGRMDREGESLTKLGRLLGIIGICVTGAFIVLGCGCGVVQMFFGPRL